MSDEPKDNYAGFDACGCMKYIVSGSMEKRALAKEVAKIIRAGLRLEMVTTSFVRSGPPWWCEVCAPEFSAQQRAKTEQLTAL